MTHPHSMQRVGGVATFWGPCRWSSPVLEPDAAVVPDVLEPAAAPAQNGVRAQEPDAVQEPARDAVGVVVQAEWDAVPELVAGGQAAVAARAALVVGARAAGSDARAAAWAPGVAQARVWADALGSVGSPVPGPEESAGHGSVAERGRGLVV